MLEMLEMLGESVSTGQNQGVSHWGKTRGDHGGDGREELQKRGDRHAECRVHPRYPRSTPFLVLLLGGCGASGCMWYCGKLPKLLVPSLPHPRDGANLSAHRRDRWGGNIDRCGRSAQNGASCMYVTILNIPQPPHIGFQAVDLAPLHTFN